MSGSDRFHRVDEIFDAALDLPEADQVAYVDRTCGHDPELRAEVSRLLRAYHRSAAFFDTPALQFAAPILGPNAITPDVTLPERIGHFRVVRVLGRGGMGDVFLGDRDDGQFEQRVALKVIRRAAPGTGRTIDVCAALN